VDVPGIARSVELLGEAYLQRVFTPSEIARCGQNVPRLAAYFAVKEAVTKALGTGLRGIDFPDIEVDDTRERPSVILTGPAMARAAELNVGVWSVSISYNRQFAVAQAIAMLHTG